MTRHDSLVGNYALLASSSESLASFPVSMSQVQTASSAALVFFDHLITADREIGLFWKRKFSGATPLFLANRYLIVTSSALILAPIFDTVGWTNRVSVYKFSPLDDCFQQQIIRAAPEASS